MGKEDKEPTNTPNIFYKRKQDYYLIFLDMGMIEEIDKKTGKVVKRRKKKRAHAKTYKEAKAILRAHENHKDEGMALAVSSTVTLLDACESYIGHMKGRWSDSYITRQEVHVNRLRAYVYDTNKQKKPVRLWTALDIEDLYTWSTVAHTVMLSGNEGAVEYTAEVIGYNTLNKLQSFLRGVWRFMLKDVNTYGVRYDVTASATLPVKKTHYEAETLDCDELNALIRYALDFEVHNQAGSPLLLLVLGACVGLRRGEICGLRWSDIEERDDYYIAHIVRQRQRVRDSSGIWSEKITTPKAGDDAGGTARERKERDVGISIKTYRLLQIVKDEQSRYRQVKEDDFVFQDPRSLLSGVAPNSKSVTRRFKEFLQRYRRTSGQELSDYRLHDMRHTCATLLSNVGIPFEQVAHQLGHVIIGTATARYVHDTGDRSDICSAMDSIITVDLKRHDQQNM